MGLTTSENKLTFSLLPKSLVTYKSKSSFFDIHYARLPKVPEYPHTHVFEYPWVPGSGVPGILLYKGYLGTSVRG